MPVKTPSDQLEVLACLVRSSKTMEEAEANPQGMPYQNYQLVEGVPFSTNWKFWRREAQGGLFDQLGEAQIRSIHFEPLQDQFLIQGTD